MYQSGQSGVYCPDISSKTSAMKTSRPLSDHNRKRSEVLGGVLERRPCLTIGDHLSRNRHRMARVSASSILARGGRYRSPPLPQQPADMPLRKPVPLMSTVWRATSLFGIKRVPDPRNVGKLLGRKLDSMILAPKELCPISTVVTRRSKPRSKGQCIMKERPA
jgi:hypothetical protein